MNKIDVKFGDWIQRGFDLYKANLGLFIPVGLLAAVLSIFSIGILAGPMMAGLIMIVLAVMDRQNPAPQIGDLFKGFSLFLPTFLYFLILVVVSIVVSFVLGLIPCIGGLLGMVLSYCIQALVMFALFNIVDRKMEVIPAIQASVETVKLNFWPFVGFGAVAGIIGGIGAIACGIGIGATLPLQICIIAVAYREIHGQPSITVEPVT